MEKNFEKVASFVQDYLMETGKQHEGEVWEPKYRWEHTLRVARWAQRLAIKENADVKKCVIAALMHDVSHFVSKDYRQHGIKSAEIAKDFLLREQYSKEFVENVTYAVESHVGNPNPKTLEAKILQDADTLDRFGYLRLLLFGKSLDFSSGDALHEKLHSFIDNLEKIEKGDFGPMWTKTGEIKLKSLLKLYKTLLQGALEETRNTNISTTIAE